MSAKFPIRRQRSTARKIGSNINFAGKRTQRRKNENRQKLQLHEAQYFFTASCHALRVFSSGATRTPRS